MFTRKQLGKLIGPLLVEQLLAVTIGIADTVMVTGVGEAAVSGVSLVDSINILLINIFSALATGGAVIAAQFTGRQETQNAGAAAKQLMYTVCVLSLLVTAACLILRDGILGAIFGRAEAAVMDNARIYFFLSALSYPFIALYNAAAALFRSVGNSRVSMLSSLLMNLINISGNALLIYGARIGVAGAALASLISRVVGAGLLLLLLQRSPQVHIDRLWRPECRPAMIRNILRIGVPGGLENGMFQIGKILLQGLIVTFGTAALAANAVAASMSTIAQIPGAAVGLAMITVVGQCMGAGAHAEAKKYTIRLTLLAYGAMGVLNILMFFLRDPIASIYDLSPEAAAITRDLIGYQCICCLLIWPAAFTLPNGLRAAGDVTFTMLVSLFSMWIFRIGFSYIFAYATDWGVLGVWVAMTIDWVFRAAAFVIRFARGRWLAKRVI